MPKLIFRTLGLSWCFPILAMAIGLLLWPRLPNNIAMHFNLAGDPDAFYPKLVALCMLPLFSFVFGFVMFAAAHYKQAIFRDRLQAQVLARICTSIAFLFFGIHMGILITSLSTESFRINEVVFLTIGIFLILFGLSAKDLAPNKHIGFKFPWNKNKPTVWARTHDLFYRWFVLIGSLFVIVTAFYPSPEVSIILVFLAVMIPTFLSYRFAKKESPNLSFRQKPKQGSPRRSF